MSNQRKLVLFIATSLDGYIATKNESLDWLFKVEGEGDNGYSEFYETVDTILMGRRTYDWIMNQETEDFPYRNKECYVFSRSVNEDNKDVKFVNENIVDFTNQLKNKDGKNIWIVGGGELLHSFVKEKLVDELILTVAPTLIGTGISLFKEDNYQLDLSLKGIRHFNQFVELHYEVKK
ncbi:dihydrofolate reductase family protein [Paenisporosarcina sp. OV554]|uniref:dihydrofolate reductase family protein n=1 Tax=Paenisporosarcina sp. OV554 TaxID=2135694 RepID=UPI000D3B1DBE|nr:dihydrofolate reductase family protein [Paenisporosarcina sp. OV554]PUB11732.1 dihydrofolate reductase [Paenisporosarcina sp. OV554]